MKKILLSLLVAIPTGIYAQSSNPQSDTLRWNASGFTDQNTNATVQKTCQFVTYGNSKIDWIQKSGTVTYTLTVNGVSGNWTDANTDGSITYNVSFNEFTGTLVITRSGAITVALNITSPSDQIKNMYSISNFDIL